MNHLEKFIEKQKQKTPIKLRGGFSVKAIGDRTLEVVGVPFGGHDNGKDSHGEFFSENTDIMMRIGDKRPALYYHGMTPWGTSSIEPEVIGEAILKGKDKRGWIFDVVLKEGSKLADRILEAAKEGLAKASSGAVNYLTRINEKTGEILTWALGELSLIDIGQGRQPANQLATVDLKSVYSNAGIELPKAFVKSGEEETDAVKENESVNKSIKRKVYIIKR